MLRTVRDERQDHPAARGVEDRIVAQGYVIRLGLVLSAKGIGGIESKAGEVIMAVVGKQQRVIVRDLLAEERNDKREGEDQKGEPRGS